MNVPVTGRPMTPRSKAHAMLSRISLRPALLSASLLLAACGGFGIDGLEAVDESEQPVGPECAIPGEGCGCTDEGATFDCYLDAQIEGDVATCFHGFNTCEGGRWTACEDVETYTMPVASAGIAGPVACNVCNPDCHDVNWFPEADAHLNDPANGVNGVNLEFDPVLGGARLEQVPTMVVMEDFGGPVGSANGFPYTMIGSDLIADNGSSVFIDPADGALILSSSPVNPAYIWIANTGEGTVSKFNVRTFTEEGRYYIGPGNADPSRTTVNSDADAFVLGRGGNRITRVSSLGSYCPDQNADSVVTTSTSGTPLAWGSDECVLWSTSLPGGRYWRAAAAQDIRDPVTGDVTERVWVGSTHQSDGSLGCTIHQIDGADGSIDMTTNGPIPCYGFAFDGSDQLWISSYYQFAATNSSGSSGNHWVIGRVDTTRCTADVGCTTAVCPGPLGSCDTAVKERVIAAHHPYGITVDFNQRVWVGGDGIARYVRTAPTASRWTRIGTSEWIHGIAADANGNVFGASGNSVSRLNADTFAYHRITGSGVGAKGAAIDTMQRFWGPDRSRNRATVITPGAALTDNTIQFAAGSVNSPYTYSDMTGEQLRLAAANRGTYSSHFDTCESPTWQDLNYDVETPGTTRVYFRFRTAATALALASAPWVGVGSVPSGYDGPGTIDLGAAILAAGLIPAQFGELEIALESDNTNPTVFVTPRVRSFSVDYYCPQYQPAGMISRIIHGGDVDNCGNPSVTNNRPLWTSFDWSVATPGSSQIILFVTTGDTEAEIQATYSSAVALAAVDPTMLSTLPIVPVAIPPSGTTGPMDLTTALDTHPLLNKNALYLGVAAILLSSADASSTPVVHSLDVSNLCVPFD